MPISRRALIGACAVRAVGVTNATGYVGQIGAMNGLPGVENTPADPPTKTAHDLRVRPYFVLFPGAGTPGEEIDLAETVEDLDWPLRITAAGSDVDDVLALVDRIHNRFFRWTPTVEGFICGPLRVPGGYEAPLLPDRKVEPHRLFVPLLYQLTAHT